MSDTKPAWLDQWLNMQSKARVYDNAAVSALRTAANKSTEMRNIMLQFPPYCVIRFPLEQTTVLASLWVYT